jgi:hypothetical protein
MSLDTFLASLGSLIATGWTDLKSFFSKLLSNSDTLITDVEAFIQKLEAAVNSPTGITIESLIPDGIGTELASIFNQIAATLLADLTYLQGLATVSGGTTSGPVLANQDAVAQTAVTKISQANADQQQSTLQEYGNRLLVAFAPAGTNLSVQQAALARAIAPMVAKQTAA